MQAGNGALANIAVRRALHTDPSDRLAHCWPGPSPGGIDPTTITALLAG